MSFVEKAAGVETLAKFERDNPLAAILLALTCTLVAFWLSGLNWRGDAVDALGGRERRALGHRIANSP